MKSDSSPAPSAKSRPSFAVPPKPNVSSHQNSQPDTGPASSDSRKSLVPASNNAAGEFSETITMHLSEV